MIQTRNSGFIMFVHTGYIQMLVALAVCVPSPDQKLYNVYNVECQEPLI